MTVRVLGVPYGAAALDALADAVAAAKRDDPMAAVTLVVPSALAGIVARRHLACRGTGVAGLEITTLARLAERLAAPRLGARRPVTRALLAAAWRRALADRLTLFAGIAGHPATVRALVDAHADLRDVSPAARAAIAATSPVTQDLVALHETVVAASTGYDRTELLQVAAGDEVRVGHVLLYLPQALTRGETAFATRLLADASDDQAMVIVGRTGAARADGAIEQTVRDLGLTPPEGRVPIATATRVITASDSDDEVRCVAREVVLRLADTPAHRIAVLYSARDPYARLLHDHLGAAGIAVNGPGSRAGDERALARLLLETLALAANDVPRGEFFQALAGAPVRDRTGSRIPLSRWERLSRSAGVVRGDDWTLRLGAFAAGLRTQADEEDQGDDPRGWLADRWRRDADAAQELADFAGRLRAELQRAGAMTTWSELARWAHDLLVSLVGDEAELRTALPPEEQDAAASIVSVLQTLAALDAVERRADLDLLRDVLAAELATVRPRIGRFGTGVFVGPVSAAIGLDVDVVFVVGLSEDLYPGRLRPDALLPDRVRDASHGELASTRERLHEQLRHLLAAFACARRECVASFPRGDLRRSVRRLPSRWLLPSLRARSGDRQLAASDWQAADYGPAMVTSGSFAGELLHTDSLATEQEWRTRQAAAQGTLDDPVVGAGVAMIRARASSEFTRYDGNLTAVGGLPDHATTDRPISPTSLEQYADCPHAYFMRRLLGIEPIEQPEEIVEVAPATVGNLIHESMDEFVRSLGEGLPSYAVPWTREQREQLIRIALAKAGQYERRGLTGHPRLWDRERQRILADLATLLDADDATRAARGARVLATELGFGVRGRDPVTVPVPEGRVLLRGSVDRVDVDRFGGLYVMDLKTGSRRTFAAIAENPLAYGTKLQLPAYAHAARAHVGNSDAPVHASYWFVRKQPGFLGYPLSPELEADYAATVGILARSIARGLFPLRAPEEPDYLWTQCEYCNPDHLGHGENRERWERKRYDPVLEGYVTLVEPDVLT